jgi:hypothetical protein
MQHSATGAITSGVAITRTSSRHTHLYGRNRDGSTVRHVGHLVISLDICVDDCRQRLVATTSLAAAVAPSVGPFVVAAVAATAAAVTPATTPTTAACVATAHDAFKETVNRTRILEQERRRAIAVVAEASKRGGGGLGRQSEHLHQRQLRQRHLRTTSARARAERSRDRWLRRCHTPQTSKRATHVSTRSVCV